MHCSLRHELSCNYLLGISMSDLPQKRSFDPDQPNVRFAPKADIGRSSDPAVDGKVVADELLWRNVLTGFFVRLAGFGKNDYSENWTSLLRAKPKHRIPETVGI